MSTPIVRTIVDGLSFPEGPRWHNGALWFSDIHAHTVYRLGEGGAPEAAATLNDRVSGLGFLPDGSLLVVSMLDRRLIAVTTDGAIRVHADLSALSRVFINDMVVDAAGRAYVGSRNGGTPAERTDSLILVSPDGSARTVADDMASPNGSVVTSDGRHLIVAETAHGRLVRFDIAADGSLSGRTVICALSGHHIDGICQDASGAFWVGGGDAGLLRITADGTLEDVIESPGRMVLATALGGPDGRTLYLATTSMALLDNLKRIRNDRALDASVNSDGRIEAMRVAIPANRTDE